MSLSFKVLSKPNIKGIKTIILRKRCHDSNLHEGDGAYFTVLLRMTWNIPTYRRDKKLNAVKYKESLKLGEYSYIIRNRR